VRDHGQVEGFMKFAWLREVDILKGSIDCIRTVVPSISALRLVIADNFNASALWAPFVQRRAHLPIISRALELTKRSHGRCPVWQCFLFSESIV
jgi:hypothetical protein